MPSPAPKTDRPSLLDRHRMDEGSRWSHHLLRALTIAVLGGAAIDLATVVGDPSTLVAYALPRAISMMLVSAFAATVHFAPDSTVARVDGRGRAALWSLAILSAVTTGMAASEVLGRDKWIPALAGRVNQINMEWVSDEAWNEIAKAKLPTLKQGQALGLDTPSELIRFAKIATEGKVLGRVGDCDAASIAAGELTVRVVNVLIGNAPVIGFSLAGYSARQKKPSPAVELLHDLGILAGVFLDHGTWRNKLAEARKAAT